MILLIDNYDSFVFNLARYLAEMGCETQVVRNDRITVRDVLALQPRAIVLSPGPCTPLEAGISMELVRSLPADWPLLGVCLGHQAIAAALGGRIVRAPFPVHGRTSLVRHAGTGLFAGLPSPFQAMRYHSLMIDEPSLPAELSVTARTLDGLPMALAHRSRPLFGVQFHPESILTQAGRRLLANFLKRAGLEASHVSPEEFLAPPLTGEKPLSSPPLDPPLHW